MNSSLTIAFKIFIRGFYLENATFFLFVLGICAGFMRDVEHIALAEFFVSRSYLLLIPFMLWLGYALKILNFNKSCLIKNENQFFFQLVFFEKKDRLIILGSIVLTQLLPVILYSTFLLSVAVKHDLHISFLVIVTCVTVLGIALIVHFQRTLHHPDQSKSTTRLVRFINRIVIRPYPLFSIEWLTRKKTFMLFGSKIFAMLTLMAVSILYTTDTYDFRLMGMALVIVVSAGAQLMFEVFNFDNHHFAYTRQLPIPISQRIFYLLVTIVMLTLPETGVMISYFPADLSILQMTEGIVFLVSGLFFWYGLLYSKNREQEQLMKMVFGYSMMSIVLILFKVPVWALAAVQFITGILLWVKYYYQYEYTESQTH